MQNPQAVLPSSVWITELSAAVGCRGGDPWVGTFGDSFSWARQEQACPRLISTSAKLHRDTKHLIFLFSERMFLRLSHLQS